MVLMKGMRMNRSGQGQEIRGRKPVVEEDMRYAKRMKTTKRGVYVYTWWGESNCDGKLSPSWRNMLEEEILLLEDVKLLDKVQYGANALE